MVPPRCRSVRDKSTGHIRPPPATPRLSPPRIRLHRRTPPVELHQSDRTDDNPNLSGCGTGHKTRTVPGQGRGAVRPERAKAYEAITRGPAGRLMAAGS